MQVKVEWLTTIKNPIIKGYGTYLVKLEDMYDDIFKQIGEKLNGITLASPLYSDEITDETLKIAAEMYLYIMSPLGEYWQHWHTVYTNWLEISSLRRLLGKKY